MQDAVSDIFTASVQGTEFTFMTVDFVKSSEDLAGQHQWP